MADVLIPVVSDSGNYSQRVLLDGKTYVLSFRFNGRMGKWIMDIADDASKLLLAGLPVLTEVGLTDRFIGSTPGLPPGRFVALDATGAHRDADEDTFGKDVTLFYMGA